MQYINEHQVIKFINLSPDGRWNISKLKSTHWTSFTCNVVIENKVDHAFTKWVSCDLFICYQIDIQSGKRSDVSRLRPVIIDCIRIFKQHNSLTMQKIISKQRIIINLFMTWRYQFLKKLFVYAEIKFINRNIRKSFGQFLKTGIRINPTRPGCRNTDFYFVLSATYIKRTWASGRSNQIRTWSDWCVGPCSSSYWSLSSIHFQFQVF